MKINEKKKITISTARRTGNKTEYRKLTSIRENQKEQGEEINLTFQK
jgi:hypothetical protein